MKRFILLPLLLMFALPLLYGQAPQKMTAQMVLRDANGLLVSNQAVAVRVSIRRTTATGITVYKETHSATTNANGLYTIFVGSGTPEVGTFSAIDWGQGPYFIVSEVDPAGGTNYTLQTAQQLVSVPYALYADSASRCAASQSLRLSHDTLFLTGGGYVRLSLGVSQRYVDSVVAVNAASTARFDSLRRANDAMVRRYDSIFNVMRQRLDSVIIDNQRGAWDAIHHLAHKGHTDIAHVTGTAHIRNFFERQDGYRQAMWQVLGREFDDINGTLVTNSPYCFLALTAMILGTQLFLTGFLGELITRNSPSRNHYEISHELL